MEWVDWSDAFVRATSWLDDIHAQITQGGDVQMGMECLHQGLRTLRRKWDREEWRRFCLEAVRSHPLREVIHKCPFTRHAFERPRGYAGDAALIDYLYDDHSHVEGLDHEGREIYRYMHDQPSARSVRERRELLAREIDATAERVHLPRILSVACGHLREAELSHAVREERVGELLAFDQDPLCLAEISREFPTGPVRTVCGSVRSMLLGKTVFRDMDFVYSAGLYDYLAEGTAARLTRLLFHMLRSGGKLLVANFAALPPETGYMEAFMDWWLVYREESQMRALTSEIDPSELAEVKLFRDSVNNVIYLSLTRR
jgi:extracellular factor (EF) 3-hydroxypalmitic acid methyl ester biosynthesis protein